MENNNITQQINGVVLENTEKPSKFDLVSRWFILIYLAVSCCGPFTIIAPLALIALFGVLGNKKWRYNATAIAAIASGLWSLGLASLSGFGYNPNGDTWFIYYIGFIHPLLSAVILIICKKLSLKLNVKK